MEIFADTANLEEIEEALQKWYITGVTTNPSLLAKEPKGKFEEHVGKIIELLKKHRNWAHLSVEVFSKDLKEIIRQAQDFKNNFQYDFLSVKVQIGWSELEAIDYLSQRGVSVNCTACMTVGQAVLAAKAGAKYVSLFWGRIRDGDIVILEKRLAQLNKDGKLREAKVAAEHLEQARSLLEKGILTDQDFDPFSVVKRTREIFDRGDYQAKIIAGSMRSVWDIRDSLLAGAHIVTVPPKFFPEFHLMAEHFKTDEVVKQFLTDFENWLK